MGRIAADTLPNMPVEVSVVPVGLPPRITHKEASLDNLRNLFSHFGATSTGAPIRGSLDSQLEEIRRRLVGDKSDDLEDLANGGIHFVFQYKISRCVGAALHIAVQCPDGHDITRVLLERGADVKMPALYKSFDMSAHVFPIHLAVQSGDPQIMKLLIEAGGDVNAPSLRDGKAHFYPLHEAAFFVQPSAVQFLLDFDAEVDKVNSKKMTPLHVAAQVGAAKVSEILISAGASKESLEEKDRTPLQVAVEAGVFEARQLFLLGNWCIKDVVTVAKFCPSATEEFLHGLHRENRGREFKGLSDAIYITECGEKLANGKWTKKDLIDDRPRYVNKSWKGAELFWDSDRRIWCITKTDDDAEQRIMYYSRETTDVIPDIGWVCECGADAPPTIVPDPDTSMVAHWIVLMDRAPDAGDELLEILTTTPPEESVFHHALPTQAMVTEMRCDYKLDKTWKYDLSRMDEDTKQPSKTEQQLYPEWHDKLAPKSHQKNLKKGKTRRASEVGAHEVAQAAQASVAAIINMHQHLGVQDKQKPVHIRLLQMPGIICVDVMQVFASTEHLGIFRSQGAQAILNYTWHSFVRRYHTAQLAHRIVELAVLLSLIWLSPGAVEPKFMHEFWYQFYLHCACSILFVAAMKESVCELFQMRGFVTILLKPEEYFGNALNYIDLASLAVFDVYAIHMQLYLTGIIVLNRDWLLRISALLATGKWIQMLYTLRPYNMRFIGVNDFIPILHSFKNMGGMFIIVCFFFSAFCHAAIILKDRPYTGVVSTIVYLFRGLVMQDGDGVNMILALGDGTEATGNVTTRLFLFVSIVTFCIVLLNVFIAVIGEAYSAAFSEAAALHLKERASICVSCMLQPEWPPRRGVFFNTFKKITRCCTRRLHPNGEGRLRTPSLRLACGPVKAYLLMLLAVFPVWAGLLAGAATRAAKGGRPLDSFWAFLLHPIFPSMVLLVVELVANSFMTQRPWQREVDSDRSFLWWCAPVSVSAASAEQESSKSIEHMARRLQGLEACVRDLMAEVREAREQAREQQLEQQLPLMPSPSPHFSPPMLSPPERRTTKARTRITYTKRQGSFPGRVPSPLTLPRPSTANSGSGAVPVSREVLPKTVPLARVGRCLAWRDWVRQGVTGQHPSTTRRHTRRLEQRSGGTCPPRLCIH